MQNSQTIIIILLVANLVATVWFGLSKEQEPVSSELKSTATHELPPAINSDVRNKLYNTFEKAFNAGDYTALYDMFGPAAKAQMQKEDVEKQFEKLSKYFKSVEGGAFTYSELATTQGNTNIYVLYYAVKLPESSAFGTSGVLKITIAVQGNEFQVYGIRLNANA